MAARFEREAARLPEGTDLDARARARDGFLPSEKWDGVREGMHFKAGAYGI